MARALAVVVLAASTGCYVITPSDDLSGGTPTVIASALDGPLPIAVRDGYVYWGDGWGGNPGAVRRCPTTGACTPAVVYDTRFQSPNAMVVDAVNVYFGSNGDGAAGDVVACRLDGGGCRVLATGQLQVRGIAVDSTTVYWSSNNDVAAYSRIASCAIDGACAAAPATVIEYPTNHPLKGIAVADATIYFADNSHATGGLYACATGGCASPPPIDPIASAQNVAVDARGSVWMTIQPGAVTTCEAPCSAASLRSYPGDYVDGIAIDDTRVYWTDWGTSSCDPPPAPPCAPIGKILSCPLAGCPTSGPTVLASSQWEPRAIAVDDTAIYWTNFAGEQPGSGSVMRLAK